MTEYPHPTRRSFLKVASACTAHLALMATPFPAAARTLWNGRTRGRVVAQESFGRLEGIGEGLWALVSTPLGGDFTTVCNGGIIAGRDGLLVIEAFQTPEGAGWIAKKAQELTGKWPTHVLVTHYHGDHTGGVEGFYSGAGHPDVDGHGPNGGDSLQSPPHLYASQTTRDLKTKGLPDDASPALLRPWADVVLVGEESPGSIDLGGRAVVLVPRRGHTASDVTAELPEEGISWCGDLVWNGMFPNYMDAVPSQLSRAVRAVKADNRQLYVPGHGPLAGAQDMTTYLEVIDGLEETARRARREGWTAEEAGSRHEIPENLGEWTLFNPSYFQRAVEAWMKEWARPRVGI